MGRRSAVSVLPPKDKAWLDQALIERGFAGYEALAEALGERGYEISRSSLHRYGSEFERRLAALKMASEQARAVAEAIPDEENHLSEGLLRLVQDKTFTMLVKMEEDPKISFANLAKVAVETAGASISVKKYAAEVKRRTREVAAEVAQVAKKGGLSEESVQAIRAKIMGIPA